MCALSYLKGLYSFGLLETRFYDQAEKVAMEVSFLFYFFLSLSVFSTVCCHYCGLVVDCWAICAD